MGLSGLGIDRRKQVRFEVARVASQGRHKLDQVASVQDALRYRIDRTVCPLAAEADDFLPMILLEIPLDRQPRLARARLA